MDSAVGEIMTYEDVERRFPDEWVLLELVQPHGDYRQKSGRLIAHSPRREDLHEAHARASAERPNAVLSEFYTGELVPEDAVVVL